MSDRIDNGMDPRPEQSAGDEAQRVGTIMVPGTPALKPLPLWQAVAWCVAAGACAGVSPIIAPLFVGFGYAILAGNGGVREQVIACAALVLSAAGSAFALRLAGVEDAVFACIVGMVGSHLYLRNKLTPGISCMSVALLSALFLAVSEGIARLAGTTLAGQFSAIMDVYLGSLDSLPIESRMLIAQMRTIVDAIWPSAFVMIAFAGFVLSIVGARLGSRRLAADTVARAPFDQFDLPLWMVACLIASIVAIAAAQALPAYTDTLLMVGGTLLMSLRLAFATQGYAVLSWFRHTRGWYGLIGLIITVIAFYLEFNMFVLTIVGVLDIWTNFRHLTRGVRVTIQDPTDRS